MISVGQICCWLSLVSHSSLYSKLQRFYLAPFKTFLVAQWVKNLPAAAGDIGSIPDSGRSPGKEMVTHSSFLAWKSSWTEESGGPQSKESERVGLSDWTTLASQRALVIICLSVEETKEMKGQSLGWEDSLEEGMATHSRIRAWRIPWTEEPDGLQSIGLPRVTHDWSDLAHTYFK